MTPQRRWPEGPDEVSAELRRALDEASLRGPDDMTLRRGWSAVAVAGASRRAPRRGFWFACGVATTAALVAARRLLALAARRELAQSSQHHRPAAKSETPSRRRRARAA